MTEHSASIRDKAPQIVPGGTDTGELQLLLPHAVLARVKAGLPRTAQRLGAWAIPMSSIRTGLCACLT
jgi:hypothetical protein